MMTLSVVVVVVYLMSPSPQSSLEAVFGVLLNDGKLKGFIDLFNPKFIGVGP